MNKLYKETQLNNKMIESIFKLVLSIMELLLAIGAIYLLITK